MASELMELIDEIDGAAAEKAEMLLAVAFARYEAGEVGDALRATDRLREMVPEPTASDLSPATCLAGAIKIITGRRAEGQRDLQVGLRLAREEDPLVYAIAVSYKTDLVLLGFDLADEALVNESHDALLRAEAFGDAYGLSLARFAHGTALLRSGDPHRDAGIELLHQSRSGVLTFPAACSTPSWRPKWRAMVSGTRKSILCARLSNPKSIRVKHCSSDIHLLCWSRY